MILIRLVIIVALVLMLLCSLSAISAEDNMENVLNSTSTHEVQILTKNLENTHSQYKSPMPSNFTSLNNIIQNSKPNEQINLTGDVIKLNSEFHTFKDGIKLLSKNITINGNGYTINANNNGRIFFMDYSNLILNNVNLVNGEHEGFGGGAIKVSHASSITLLDNVNFINNTAITSGGYGGGAIYLNYDSIINIKGKNISFINNHAVSNSCAGAIGLYRNNTLNITGENIFFVNNSGDTTLYGGGTITAFYNNVLNFNGKNMQFINNSVATDGAAVFRYDNSNTIQFRGSNILFINNKGRNALSGVSFSNAVLLGNSIIKGGNLNENYWGCIENPKTLGYLSGSVSNWIVPTIKGNTTIFRNSPYRYTVNFNQTNLGTIINPDSLADFNITVTLNGIDYKKVLVHEGKANFDLSYEKAGLNNLIVKDSITNNELLKFTVNVIPDCTYYDLSLTINSNNNSLIVLNKDYYYNSSYDIQFAGGIKINRDLVIDGCGHYISGSNLNRIFSIENSSILKLINIKLIQGNSSFGGAIYLDGFSSLNVSDNVSFINNTAGSDGGAVYSLNGNLTVNGSNILFENNKAGSSAGAIKAHNLIINGWEIIFINNTAVNSRGGAIDAYNGFIHNTLFLNNTAVEGQAIYNNHDLIVEDCKFKNTDFNALIYNNGTLSLRNNSMISGSEEKIYNNGIITSTVNLIIENKRIVYGDKVLLSAHVTDDNDNKIIGQEVKIQNNIYGLFNLSNLNNGIYNYEFTPYKTGIFRFNGTYKGTNNITVHIGTLTVSKANVSMVVSPVDIVFGSDMLISGSVTGVNGSVVDGVVQITVNDVGYTVTLVNGRFSLVIPDLGAGNYTVLSSFLGNKNYNAITVTNNFTVSKANVSMVVSAEDIVFGSDALISGSVTGVNGSVVDGVVQITVNDVGYTVTLVNGRFNHTVSGLNTGNYTVLVGLINRNYNGLTVNSTFRVKPCLSELLINMNSVFLNEPIGFNLTIATATNVSANGNISVHILDLNGNVIYSSLININKSFNKISLPALDKTGNYSISITFSGYNFISSNTSCNFRVVEFFSLVANDLILYYHNGSAFQVLLTHGSLPVANEKIYLFINGVNYTRGTDEKGYAYLNINLLPGKYRISISYQNITIIRTVTVLSTVQCSDLVKYYCNASQFYASFVDNNGNPLRNSKVQFYINGVTYNRFTDNHGIAFLNINLLPGIYKISSTNLINNQTCYNNVHVLSTIHSDNVIKYYKNRTHYNIQIFDDNGKPAINRIVSILINGILYKKVTDSSGIAKLNINLIPGEYKVIVTDLKNNLRVSNNIKVLPKITSNDVISIKDNPCLSKVKLLDDRGFPAINKKIKLNINGVFYYKHTDNKGIAIFELNLKPGTYTATAYYEENAVSNRIFISG